MRVLVFLLLWLLVTVRCRSIVRSDQTEAQTDLDQQRSARVHRVADNGFPGTEDTYARNTVTEESTNHRPSSGIPDLNDLLEREAELFKELKVILKELSREETVALKNVDLAIKGITNTTTPVKSIKSATKNANGSRNLLNSPEQLDIYYPDDRNGVNLSDSRSFTRIEPTNNPELKTMKTIVRYLDNVMLEVQNHILYIRNIFDKLCRKHRSKSLPLSDMDNSEKAASANQPKKVSIL
ncbi:uncharacterized protein LOC143376276 [Andrena cerasifolii]|uniref:uncharacterized protein LOC143376276 n=1 Tax=Andrena cerasifolii TaxID=2819439 RepID=UPI004038452E